MATGLKSGHLQLGAQSIKVRIVPGLYKRRKLYGDANFNKNEIRLAGDMSDTVAVDTFLHEITHFLLAGCPISSKDDEYIAGVMGRGLASLFRDNPEWMGMIAKIFWEDKKCQQKSTHNHNQIEPPRPVLYCKPRGRLRPRRT